MIESNTTTIEENYTRMLRVVRDAFDGLLRMYQCSGNSEQIGIVGFRGSFDHKNGYWTRTLEVSTQYESATIDFVFTHSGRHGELLTKHKITYYCATNYCTVRDFILGTDTEGTLVNIAGFFTKLELMKAAIRDASIVHDTSY